MVLTNSKSIQSKISELSSSFNKTTELAIILAAGHGKRIKSQRSKMLHKIWEIPTVERVSNACSSGIKDINQVIVVGIKALDVLKVIGKRKFTKFAYQEVQNGTGHAVQIALDVIKDEFGDGIVYVLPGDMGLLDSVSMEKFRHDFLTSHTDMMVLTGIYGGDPLQNSYGRIIRVKANDELGNPSGNDEGKVIQIMEFKDILALPDDQPYKTTYKNRDYSFNKGELLNINEFNSGVYAFSYKKLVEQIFNISSDNAQNEIYITDLISLFNKAGYSVSAASPKEQHVVMGFNNKSVLKQMEKIARDKVYEQLKDIVEVDDPDDFFIHYDVVQQLIEMDARGIPLDITIGKGVYIGAGVKLNYNLHISKNVFIDGNVVFGRNVTVLQNVHLSCFSNQTLKIGNNVRILWGDIIKGNIVIGNNSVIESSVNMTGSDDFPLRIGKNVLIKGTSYIFGSVIEDGIQIEHSVIIKKTVKAVKNKKGYIKPVRFYLPETIGRDLIRELK